MAKKTMRSLVSITQVLTFSASLVTGAFANDASVAGIAPRGSSVSVGLASAPPAVASAADVFSKVREDWERGNVEAGIDVLEDHLTSAPTDSRAQALLAGSLIKIGQAAEAERAIATLEGIASTEEDRKAVTGLKSVLRKFNYNTHCKEILAGALKRSDFTGALAAVDSFEVSDAAKAVLRAHLDGYRGDFASAKSRLETISFERHSQKRRLDGMEKDLDESAKRYAVIIGRADQMLYSGVSASVFGAEFSRKVPEIANFKLTDYLEAVDAAVKVAPLSDHALDLAFHEAMLTADFDAVASLGDRILAAKGSIRIPCVSTDRYFDLVIDARSRRIFTEEDTAHRFSVVFAGGGEVNSPKNEWIGPFDAFSLTFDQINRVRQETKHDFRIQGLRRGSYVLDLGPKAVVSQYALMGPIHMSYGEAIQKKATLNLGKFVLHILARPVKDIELVNPAKKTVDGARIFAIVAMGLAGAAGNMAQSNGNVAVASQMQTNMNLLSASVEKMDAAQALGDATKKPWYAEMGAHSVEFLDQQAFDELDDFVKTLLA
jgi:hypothetical protein